MLPSLLDRKSTDLEVEAGKTRIPDTLINASSLDPTGNFTVSTTTLSNVTNLSRFCPDRRDAAHVLLLLGMPGIVGRLHARPRAGPIAKQLAEAHGDRERHRLALAHDVVEMPARDTQQAGDLRLGSAGRRNHVLAQKSAGMSRTTGSIAPGNVGHGSNSH